ncbi:MAG: protein translocase subunit SecF [Nanoarchaeota archaeon]
MSKRRLRRLKKKEIIEQKPNLKKSLSESSSKIGSKESKQKTHKNFFLNLFDKQYKKLLFIPIILLLLAFAQIGYQYSTTEDLMNKGVSLSGGLTLTVTKLSDDIDILKIEETLNKDYPQKDITLRKLSSGLAEASGIVIEIDIFNEDEINEFQNYISNLLNINKDLISIDVMGPSLGESFFKQALIAMIVALLLMGIVVFLYFRTFIPSFAVILAVISNIIITLAIVNLLNIKLSTAGVAAFLMLIGYSVDSDILLTTKLLKNKNGLVFNRLISAMKTGLTMSITTIIAITVGLILSQSEVLTQIMTIMLIGLFVDLINTWLQNTAILRLYIEKKGLE